MKVAERFLKYVEFDSPSNEGVSACPSNPKELELGAYIAKELKAMGLKTVHDKYGYLYAHMPANGKNLPSIGLIAHMDVSNAVNAQGIKAKTIKYQGGDIKQSSKNFIKEKDYPFLKKYIGQNLIISDGTTLLGADDKAGIAEILCALEYLKSHPEIKHGKIAVGITVDEEIGRGADHFNLKNFGADFAYTVDGGTLGELEYECFNAASAKIKITGLNVHPGSAKGIMKNAVLIANEFISMLPPLEDPAHTSGYEGFYHVQSISGDESLAEISMIIRDHDKKKFAARKSFIEKIAKKINKKYGAESLSLEIKDTYYNMKEIMDENIFVVERAKDAMKEAGVNPIVQPIRGGTDGAVLSFKGLPCPNISAGGENFHSIKEFVSIESMEKMVEVIVNIVKEVR